MKLPTDMPPQLMPPVMLAAKDSLRLRSDIPIEMGLEVPFVQEGAAILIESDRDSVRCSASEEMLLLAAALPGPFMPFAPCSAVVRFDFWSRGDMEDCRWISIGEAAMICEVGEVPNSGNGSDSGCGSVRVESRNRLDVLGAFSIGRLNQGNGVSLADLRETGGPNPTGVLTGVDSREDGALSLSDGERCKDGGLSE